MALLCNFLAFNIALVNYLDPSRHFNFQESRMLFSIIVNSLLRLIEKKNKGFPGPWAVCSPYNGQRQFPEFFKNFDTLNTALAAL